MTKREKMLGAIVGVLGVAVGGVVASRSVMGAFASRDQQIIQLEGQIQDKQLQIDRSARLKKRITEYEERSLPSNDELAKARYKTWLTEKVEKSKLKEIAVVPRPTRPNDTFKTFSFTVTGTGDVAQIVRFLQDFYSIDHLHRVISLRLVPIPDTREIDMTMTVEALAVSTAAPDKQLTTRPGTVLASADRERYLETIVNRNFFGPPNNPPKLAVGDQRAIINRPFSFDLHADDADKLDAVSYVLEDDELHGARLDPKSGKFNWTPTSLGKFSFIVKATDNGLPAKTTDARFTVNVSDPPPPPAPAPKALGFDHAKHAYITGIVSKGGRRQLWLTVRTTGQQLRLFEGDPIELGSVKGRLLWLTDREGEIATEAGRIMFGVGDCLGEAQTIKTSTPASAPRAGASG